MAIPLSLVTRKLPLSLLPIAALILLPRLWFLSATQITYEDALISLRYAENLTRGLGLVYNPGERVFGASTPLYVLLLAGLSALRLAEPLFWAKLLCVLADGVSGMVWYRLIRRETGSHAGALAFLAAFAFSPYVVEVTVSGMETSLVLLCLTLAFEAVYSRRGLVLGLWLGLLLLLRVDTALFIAILLWARMRREQRVPWREAWVVGAIAAPWFLFSLAYYGSLIPNSIPAKLSAYNLHTSSMTRWLSFTVSHFTPFRNGVKESTFAALFLPVFLVGVAAALRRHRTMLPVALFFFADWAFLVVPRTLIFRWYIPPLLLPYFVVGGVGVAALLRWHASTGARPALRRALCGVLVAGLALHTSHWLFVAADRTRAVQAFEETIRKPVGLWLASHTPSDALVSLEPIGYIGYYSRRRVLDEVGLVSPGVIPFTRRGAGWFTAVISKYQPDYIVERPHFLMTNKTINSGVPMFAGAAERDWFWRNYEPVREFTAGGTRLYRRAYTFVVLKRRSSAETQRHALTGPRLPGSERVAGVGWKAALTSTGRE